MSDPTGTRPICDDGECPKAPPPAPVVGDGGGCQRLTGLARKQCTTFDNGVSVTSSMNTYQVDGGGKITQTATTTTSGPTYTIERRGDGKAADAYNWVSVTTSSTSVTDTTFTGVPCLVQGTCSLDPSHPGQVARNMVDLFSPLNSVRIVPALPNPCVASATTGPATSGTCHTSSTTVTTIPTFEGAGWVEPVEQDTQSKPVDRTRGRTSAGLQICLG